MGGLQKPTVRAGYLALVSVFALVIAGCSGGSSGRVTPATSAGTASQARSALSTTASPACFAAWSSSAAYNGGAQVSYGGVNYTAAYWTQGNNPSTNNGAAGSGQPWISDGACGGTTPSPSPSSSPGSSGCYPAWSSSTAYNGGAHVSYQGVNYTAAFWTQGNIPSTSNGPAGSGQPWISDGACGGGAGASPTPSPLPSSAPSGPPPGGFIFSPYKDATINLNWNTDVISTAVTGAFQPLLSVMPVKNTTVTLAFATGACGSENWGGVPAASMIAANLQNFVQAGKYYIISTGGAGGTFTCSSSSGFLAFVQSYYTSHMLGVDFDIEAGQTQSQITSLVQDVVTAESAYPSLRFSFTIATEGGNASPSLNSTGVAVMDAIKSVGLTKYTINLMTMDYGSAIPGNCVVSNGACEMGSSAAQAAVDLHNQYGVPYNQIELTPMIGGNDTQGEVFTIADAVTVSNFVLQNGLAGLHFWSFDRDTDCTLAFSSPTCNSYGQAGTLGFTNAFISDLHL
jgi:chitinase